MYQIRREKEARKDVVGEERQKAHFLRQILTPSIFAHL